VSGQSVALAGVLNDEESRHATIAAAKKAIGAGGVVFGGVTAIKADKLTIKAPPPLVEPYKWAAEYSDNVLSLRGHVPSEDIRDLILSTVARSFPGGEINDTMTVARGAPQESAWPIAVSTSLHALSRLDSGTVDATAARFSLTGAASDSDRADALSALMNALPKGFDGELNIEVPSEDVSEPAEKTDTDPRSILETCYTRLWATLKNQSVNFESASADIENFSIPFLRRLASALNECPDFAIEISGHTDPLGDELENIELSARRAQSVAAFLSERGVARNRLKTLGHGSSLPIVSNETAFGRAQNRRIEFIINYGDGAAIDSIGSENE
ncbi:MAG: OmpA family protein, partial [Pseudomonadota bacterium]